MIRVQPRNFIGALLLMVGTVLAPMSVIWAQSNTFDSKQRSAIEVIVHDYLVNNPEVLLEAVNALQGLQEETMLETVQEGIAQNAQALLNDGSPVAGNLAGNVTLVEFFDYQCVYCKRMQPVVNNLIANDPNLRIVFKEFPVFGAESQYAAKAALAAQKQGKYFEFHQALMSDEQRLSEKRVLSIAKTVGIDVDQLQQDMQSPEIATALQDNQELASSLGLMGTPAFIIASYPITDDLKALFVPGQTSESNLQNLITQART